MDLKESIESILRAEEYETYENNDIYKIPLKNISILLKMYNNEKGNEPLLINTVFNYNNPHISYLGFEFLIRIKELKKAFDFFERNLNKIRGLRQVYFSEYYSLFNKCLGRLNYLIDDTNLLPGEIEKIRTYVLDLTRLLPKRHSKLREDYYSSPEISINHELRKEIIRKLELKKALVISDIYNSDIKREDIKNVVEKIKELDFPGSIALAFKKLEQKFYEAEDMNEFAMFGGYIRQTLMGLVKEISLKIAEDKEEVIKEKDEHYRNYLRSAGLINDGLWRMISALYDFLSCGLNHNIEADKEYYKVGLNITAQVSYLLLKEYEKYVIEKKRKLYRK
jgi:hypothetical protein